ncbi:TrbI/VirB10 family protein [Fusobacterium sp. PH5-44]|uniref:TrbI/VirB10 family protein n=1 Tax=unclassified Fusobacterium TaxID=2648384 RepID=UPI003D1B81E1
MNQNNNPLLEEENTPQPAPAPNNRNRQGKHIRFKQIGAVFFVIFIFFLYNVLKERPQPQSSTQNNEQETIGNTENPFASSYSDKRNDPTYENAPISDIKTDNKVAGGQNNINQELLRLRLEEMKKRKEREEKAKNSPISFRGISSSVSSNNSSSQTANSEQQEQDYDSNRQASKKNFLWNEKAPSFYGKGRLISALSPYELKAGDFIPAIMQNAIDSDLPAKTIVALVRENVYDTLTGNYLLIPQGTKIQGTYDSNVTFGQNRLLVIWQRLIFPNGKSIELGNMQGVDLSGRVGMTGKVNNHFGTLLKGVILSSIAGAAGSVVTSDRNDSVAREAANGAGEQIVKIGEKFADKALSRQPTIDIKIGTRFNIMVHSDLILEPYEK